ncbi:unnamed protein product [Nippostrongylus brasiliensis]|uniref:Secreted protein n=1 Tax=Nippostrongylus brasiliensis TaxID=27835 RepID=A0A0N4YNN4_NIPBR|nr:unnamed protein product [Nippostrongylus brasiliensis]
MLPHHFLRTLSALITLREVVFLVDGPVRGGSEAGKGRRNFYCEHETPPTWDCSTKEMFSRALPTVGVP